MTNKEITSLAFKVFALYVLLMAITQMTQFSYFYNSFFSYNDMYYFVIPVLVIVVLFLLFIVLWKLSNSVEQTMTKAEGFKDELRVDQPFVLNIVGFYLLLNGLLELTSGVFSLFLVQISLQDSLDQIIVSPNEIQPAFFVFGSFLKVIIALTLILRSKGWIKIFNKLRQL